MNYQQNLKISKLKINTILRILILFIVLFILKSNITYSLGSIQTSQVLPQTINLCGTNSQYVTITAYNILNLENNTLTNVDATLIINGNTGLSFMTSQTINLGNINPLSYSYINPSWILQCNSPNSGLYNAYINYSSSNGYKASSIGEINITIIVHDSIEFTGNISFETNSDLISQNEIPIIKDNRPTIKVATTKNSICKGNLDNDKDYDNMDFLFYGLEKDHNYTFINQLSEGNHLVFVKCKDDLNNIFQTNLQFIIDSKEPIISILQPKNIVLGDYTELLLELNEIAECKYSKSDIDFMDMKPFENINTTLFKVKIDNLEEKGYNYYVKCKDKIGNLAKKIITFEVVIPPRAQIQIEKTGPLSKGNYELKLIPSKKLKSAYLSYSFTDEPEIKREIGLVREGNYYKGYLIIDEQQKTRQGLFTFKGYDLQDIEGTEITDGTFFIVDTTKPIAPETLQGKNTEKGILLRWYYDGEKPEKFNIYRSTVQGITPIFYYDSVELKDSENFYEYIDKNVQSGQLYYYRIAAVDIAGNLGYMSNEISVYSTNEIKTETQEIINLPTQQTRDMKKTTEKNIDSLLIDLEWALTNLKDQSTKEKSIEDLSLIKKVLNSKGDIENQKNYLKNINLNEISDTELRTKLSEIDSLIARTKKLTPKSLEIEKTTTQLQSLTNSDIESIIREIIESQNYTESQIKKYLKEIYNINKDLKVESEIKTLKIIYLDDSTENQILVRKIFSYEKPESIKDVIIIEMIPKTVAGDISSIDIKTPDYSIVKSDPIISWKYQELNYDKQQYYYLLLSNDNSESAKSTKTIAILDPIKIINNQDNLLTGFSIFITTIKNNTEYLGLVIGSLIIMVLLIYYLFTTNSIELKNLSFRNKNFKNKGLKNLFTKPLNILKLKNKDYSQNNNSTINDINTDIKKDNPTIINNNINYNKEINNENNLLTNNNNKDITNRYNSNKDKISINKKDNITSLINNLIIQEDITKISANQYFYAKNGEIIRGISELKDSIEKMDDFTFYYHFNESKNDFAEWLYSLYPNKELYDFIKSIKTKEEFIQIFEKI